MQDDTGFTGKVTAYDPPHLLSYTWGEGTGEGPEVTYELKAQGERASFVLTHRRLGDDRDVIISVVSGWHMHLEILGDKLNGGEPKGFWRVHNKMEKNYAVLLDN